MITKTDIDGGHAFDWGKTSPDYAVYRPGYPASFYTVLQAVGIGTLSQDILDLGTGTGVLARAFAQQGAHVIGIDIAEAQIVTARQLAAQESRRGAARGHREGLSEFCTGISAQWGY